MAFTTPNMGLKVWNLVSDPYDHDQLAANWVRLDRHDHGANGGEQISTAGLADGAVTGTKIALGSITGANIQDGSITTGELADGAVSLLKAGTDLKTDYGYAFSNWRTLWRFYAVIGSGNSTATQILTTTGATPVSFGLGAPMASLVNFFHNGDWNAGSRTCKVRIRAYIDVNNVSPTAGTNVTVDLRRVNATTLNVTPSPWYISSTGDTTVLASVNQSPIASGTIYTLTSPEYALTDVDFRTILTSTISQVNPANCYIGISAEVHLRFT